MAGILPGMGGGSGQGAAGSLTSFLNPLLFSQARNNNPFVNPLAASAFGWKPYGGGGMPGMGFAQMLMGGGGGSPNITQLLAQLTPQQKAQLLARLQQGGGVPGGGLLG